eukprot:scaffold1426_cov263-Pinguiococcus_pyrenoidosus.AAC.5
MSPSSVASSSVLARVRTKIRACSTRGHTRSSQACSKKPGTQRRDTRTGRSLGVAARIVQRLVSVHAKRPRPDSHGCVGLQVESERMDGRDQRPGPKVKLATPVQQRSGDILLHHHRNVPAEIPAVLPALRVVSFAAPGEPPAKRFEADHVFLHHTKELNAAFWIRVGGLHRPDEFLAQLRHTTSREAKSALDAWELYVNPQPALLFQLSCCAEVVGPRREAASGRPVALNTRLVQRPQRSVIPYHLVELWNAVDNGAMLSEIEGVQLRQALKRFSKEDVGRASLTDAHAMQGVGDASPEVFPAVGHEASFASTFLVFAS